MTLQANATTNTRTGEFDESQFWHSLIPESVAAEFLGLKTRSMQAKRQRGGGPIFVRLSARCVRYRRIDLRKWSEERLRNSTSDPGPEADAA